MSRVSRTRLVAQSPRLTALLKQLADTPEAIACRWVNLRESGNPTLKSGCLKSRLVGFNTVIPVVKEWISWQSVRIAVPVSAAVRQLPSIRASAVPWYVWSAALAVTSTTAGLRLDEQRAYRKIDSISNASKSWGIVVWNATARNSTDRRRASCKDPDHQVSLISLQLTSQAGMAELADAADSKSLLPCCEIPISTVIS